MSCGIARRRRPNGVRAHRLALLLEDAAVQHRHLLAREAGALVEAVDVLRDEEAQLLAPRQLDERAVRQRRSRRREVDLARPRRRRRRGGGCGCGRGRGRVRRRRARPSCARRARRLCARRCFRLDVGRVGARVVRCEGGGCGGGGGRARRDVGRVVVRVGRGVDPSARLREQVLEVRVARLVADDATQLRDLRGELAAAAPGRPAFLRRRRAQLLLLVALPLRRLLGVLLLAVLDLLHRPDAVGAAEVGDAGGRRDARARQDDQVLRLAHQLDERVQARRQLPLGVVLFGQPANTLVRVVLEAVGERRVGEAWRARAWRGGGCGAVGGACTGRRSRRSSRWY